MRLLALEGMNDAMALRRWDDRAKVHGVEVPDLNAYKADGLGPSPVEEDSSEISSLGVAHHRYQLHKIPGTTQGQAPQTCSSN